MTTVVLVVYKDIRFAEDRFVLYFRSLVYKTIDSFGANVRSLRDSGIRVSCLLRSTRDHCTFSLDFITPRTTSLEPWKELLVQSVSRGRALFRNTVS